MATPAKLGFFVNATAKPDAASSSVEDFIRARYALMQASEPDTLQWFALKADEKHYLVFNTFATEAARQAHIDNAHAAPGMTAQRDALLVEGDEGLSVKPIELLGAKATRPPGGSGVTQGLTCGVRVLWTVTDDHAAEEVKGLMKDLGVKTQGMADPSVWYAFWFPGTNQFGVLALFDNEEKREAHTNARTTEAKQKYGDRLTSLPEAVYLEVLTAKF